MATVLDKICKGRKFTRQAMNETDNTSTTKTKLETYIDEVDGMDNINRQSVSALREQLAMVTMQRDTLTELVNLDADTEIELREEIEKLREKRNWLLKENDKLHKINLEVSGRLYDQEDVIEGLETELDKTNYDYQTLKGRYDEVVNMYAELHHENEANKSYLNELAYSYQELLKDRNEYKELYLKALERCSYFSKQANDLINTLDNLHED